jgi:hypothetical protein
VISVKAAIYAKLIADTGGGGVVTLLGAARIYYRQPPADATTLFPRITYGEVVGNEDVVVPRRVLLMLIDYCSLSSDLNDTLAARGFTLFHKKPLVISDGVVRSIVLQDQREVPDPDPDVRHLAQTFRLVVIRS